MIKWFKERKAKRELYLDTFHKAQDILWNDFIERGRKEYEETGNISDAIYSELHMLTDSEIYFMYDENTYKTNLFIIDYYKNKNK